MSDLESFLGAESMNQGSTPESFRLFQERMKVASSQIQAIRAGEQKQKKKEDELAKILSEFIQKHQSDSKYSEFIVQITRLLAQNIPAVLILSLILLNFPELQERSNLKMLSFQEMTQAGGLENPTLPDLYMKNSTLPLQIKIAIDAWLQSVSGATEQAKTKLANWPLSTLLPPLLDCATFSLYFYLQTHESAPPDQQQLRPFLEFCLKGILTQPEHPLLA